MKKLDRRSLAAIIFLCGAACLAIQAFSARSYVDYIDFRPYHPLPSGLTGAYALLSPAYLLLFVFGGLSRRRVFGALALTLSAAALISAAACFYFLLRSGAFGAAMLLFEALKVALTALCAALSAINFFVLRA